MLKLLHCEVVRGPFEAAKMAGGALVSASAGVIRFRATNYSL